MTHAHFDYETELWQKGFRYVAGIDEVGRGPLAGPVVAAVVILPIFTSLIKPLRDSKKHTAKQRTELNEWIRDTAVEIGIGKVSPEKIDSIGIAPATELAMKRAIGSLSTKPDFYLIDHFTIPGLRFDQQKGITKGDSICTSIAAASIVAKVYRDSLMVEMHNEHPDYGFDRHKGYGTVFHRMAIQKHGPCKIHRKTFHVSENQ